MRADAVMVVVIVRVVVSNDVVTVVDNRRRRGFVKYVVCVATGAATIRSSRKTIIGIILGDKMTVFGRFSSRSGDRHGQQEQKGDLPYRCVGKDPFWLHCQFFTLLGRFSFIVQS